MLAFIVVVIGSLTDNNKKSQDNAMYNTTCLTPYAMLDARDLIVIPRCNIILQLLLILAVFLASLLVAMASSAWFTRRLEDICDLLDLPSSLLSLLGALGANIPNYIASIVAIAAGQVEVGLGIIIGSNIYNVAIIMGISVFAVRGKHEIVLSPKEARDARVVGIYALAIMLATLLLLWLLPRTAAATRLTTPAPLLVSALTLVLFLALAVHTLRRPHTHTHTATVAATATGQPRGKKARIVGEGLLALAIALIAVIVMVNAGQALTVALRIPPVLAGLLVLAVATSLPNTVVAFNLARSGRETACVEEIFSSNSINAALGIALPLLLWHAAPANKLLLWLDGPLMAALALVLFLCVLRRRLNHLTAALLLLAYALWVVAHIIF